MKRDCGCEHCPGEDECNCTGDEWDLESPPVILCELHREILYGRMAHPGNDYE